MRLSTLFLEPALIGNTSTNLLKVSVLPDSPFQIVAVWILLEIFPCILLLGYDPSFRLWDFLFEPIVWIWDAHIALFLALVHVDVV